MTWFFTAKRLRLLVIAVFLAVLGTTVASFLARQKERSRAQSLPPKIAPEVNQQTQAFSLSKTVEDHTLYTVQAEQVTYLKDSGKAVLRGVSIFLYGKQGQRRDRVWSQECEFDPAAGTLWIPGQVEMELGIPVQEPQAVPGPTAPAWVSVVTSGLSFDQNTGIASTEREVQFRFAEGQGSAQGAIYDPQKQLLTLPADVRLNLQDSAPSETLASMQSATSVASGVSVRSGNLQFHREERVIYLGAPVTVTQGPHRLLAGKSEIILDAQNRARTALLTGGVVAMVEHPDRSSEIRAGSGQMEFNERGKMRLLVMENQAKWVSTSQDSQQEGKAGKAELFFSEPDDLLNRIRAYDSVQISFRDLSPPPTPPRTILNRPLGPSLGKGAQNLSAPQVDIFFRSDGKMLRQLLTQSPSQLELIPSEATQERWTIEGADFRMDFDAQSVLSQFFAEGNVRAVAEAQKGPPRKQVLTSQSLQATYSPATGGLEKIEQWGKFRYQDPDKQAQAERAEYLTGREEIVLQGDAMLWNSRGRVASERMVWNGATGQMTADGHVFTTYFPTPSSGAPLPQPVQIVAERLQYASATGRAQYLGKVRLWQGKSLLETDRLELDREQGQLFAQGNVYSVLQQLPEGSQRRQEPLEIRSYSLLYWQKDRKAQYQGDVRMQSASANLTAAELEVFLEREDSNGARAVGTGVEPIEHAVARGSVQILEGARKATATWAEYFPARGELHLFGEPAVVEDPQRGVTRGVRLTYRIGDDSMAVDGKPGLPAETRRQVLR